MFFSLKDLVPKTAGKFQLQGEIKAAMVINRCSALLKEMFPEEIEQHIRVKKFKDGVLWLSVTNAALNQEVQMKGYALKNSLNKSFAEELVKNIRSYQEVEPPEEDWG